MGDSSAPWPASEGLGARAARLTCYFPVPLSIVCSAYSGLSRTAFSPPCYRPCPVPPASGMFATKHQLSASLPLSPGTWPMFRSSVPHVRDRSVSVSPTAWLGSAPPSQLRYSTLWPSDTRPAYPGCKQPKTQNTEVQSLLRCWGLLRCVPRRRISGSNKWQISFWFV